MHLYFSTPFGVASLHVDYTNPFWVASQFFAFLAFIFSVWSWQIKEKVRMMTYVGTFSAFLAISASLLQNYTLGVLFGLAAIRNFVFSNIDGRIAKGEEIPKRVPYTFAGIFAFATIASTIILVYIVQVPSVGAWLEWLICVTLLGLIIGNVQEGTDLMRVSFIMNRIFNIINHAYFNNIIAVIIAVSAIGSNIIFYLRELIGSLKARKATANNLQTTDDDTA